MIWEPDGGRLVTIPRVRSVSRARWRGNQLLLLGAHEHDPADITPETRIHVVDATTLERLDVLTGPREPIRTFAIAGPFVCAVSEDRKISIWRHAA